ncbi:pentapeptide repeat-containing protein [Escherichia albertii]|uniref:pentapeptide repeat-containing protein n=1 Tax=Escherichia albertii TaxID=208962 RepID=UPI000743B468|nr:pentapeptide repeat-containing protein [Escherichia albertii]
MPQSIIIDKYNTHSNYNATTHEVFNSDTHIGVESLLKQISYDIKHQNDNFIKRALVLIMHFILNPDDLELTLDRYSSTTEKIFSNAKRNGQYEFEFADIKVNFMPQNEKDGILTVSSNNMNHSGRAEISQINELIKTIEQKGQLPIYIDMQNFKESVINISRSEAQELPEEQHLPFDKFLTYAYKETNSFNVVLDANQQYRHLDNFMIYYDPIDKQLTIRDNKNTVDMIPLTNLQWENLLKYASKGHQQSNTIDSNDSKNIKEYISSPQVSDYFIPDVKDSIVEDLYSIANYSPDKTRTNDENWKRLCQVCDQYNIIKKNTTDSNSKLLTRDMTISDTKIKMTFHIGDYVINTVEQAIPKDDMGQLSLEGLDLSGMNLSRFNFSGMNLRNVNFQDSILKRAIFNNATLDGAILLDCDINHADFTDASLMKVDFEYVNNMKGVIFLRANLRECNFKGHDFSGVNFTQADLRNANLEYVFFINTVLDKTLLAGAVLNHSNLSGKDLSGYDLTGVKLNHTILTKTILNKAILDDAEFNFSTLTETVLTEATGSNINFNRARITNVIFDKANLNNVSFHRAWGKYVSFYKTKMNEIDFTNANFNNFIFNNSEAESINFSKAKLENCFFIETNWSNVNFSESNILHSSFYKAIFQEKVYFDKATFKNVNFNNAQIPESHFNGVKSINVSFLNSNLHLATFENVKTINSINTDDDYYVRTPNDESDITIQIFEMRPSSSLDK